MQNKNKSLAALVLRLLTISKYDWHLLKIVTVKYLQKLALFTLLSWEGWKIKSQEFQID